MRLEIRVVATSLAVVAVLVATVLGAATSGGSWELRERDLGGNGLDVAPAPIEDPVEMDVVDVEPPAEPADWRWLGFLVWAALISFGVFVLYRLWRWLRERDVPRRRMSPAGVATGEEEEPELPVLRRGVTEAQRFLEQIAGRPTDAIIAAWIALEEAAADSGVRRRPSETPTEFTVAVLQRTHADPDATAELLALYHRARFSGSPIGTDDVVRASDAFGRLALGWDAVASSGITAANDTTTATADGESRS